MGGSGFSIPPAMKYLRAKIIVLNDNKTTKNVSDVFFFFFLSLGEKKICLLANDGKAAW